MKKNIFQRILLGLLLGLLGLTGCGKKAASPVEGSKPAYQKISQEEAMQMMEEQEDFILLDVRTREEYAQGHIPGAICVPNEEIGTEQPSLLPDLAQTILVYCRSGNRSAQAASKLSAMGYTGIYEFGGINTWTGEVVTGEE